MKSWILSYFYVHDCNEIKSVHDMKMLLLKNFNVYRFHNHTFCSLILLDYYHGSSLDQLWHPYTKLRNERSVNRCSGVKFYSRLRLLASPYESAKFEREKEGGRELCPMHSQQK